MLPVVALALERFCASDLAVRTVGATYDLLEPAVIAGDVGGGAELAGRRIALLDVLRDGLSARDPGLDRGRDEVGLRIGLLDPLRHDLAIRVGHLGRANQAVRRAIG